MKNCLLAAAVLLLVSGQAEAAPCVKWANGKQVKILNCKTKPFSRNVSGWSSNGMQVSGSGTKASNGHQKNRNFGRGGGKL